MKQNLLFFLFFLLPFSLLAQDNPTLFKDFYKDIRGAKSFVFDDHINIMQVNTDNENFDIVAVNEQMQVLWKTSLEGFVLTTAKFKGKIIAVASTDHSKPTGSNNTYKGYLIDPANGKLLVEKVIYNSTDQYMEFPSFFTGGGAFFKFCVRKTGFERRLHVALPSFFALISMNKYEKEFNESSELSVISLNESLDPISSLKLPIANGTMINWCANKQADLFVAWLNGPAIEVYKFPDGSASPVKQLNADITFKVSNSVILQDYIKLLPSTTNNDILYYGLTYLNQDKNDELGIGKFDFASGKKTYTAEEFTKDHVKSLEKSFVPFNKKIDDADLSNRKDIQLMSVAEWNGTLVATLASRTGQSGQYGPQMDESSLLINGYDGNLNTKFQQILPSGYLGSPVYIPTGYYSNNNKLYVVSNKKSGMRTYDAIYGCLDLGSGKWDNMALLSKKKMDNIDHCMGDAILWFPNSYVAPYFSVRGIGGMKFDITLQQNNY
jgi:hypothetical protein